MLDVHLMIERPERQVAEFAKAGADSITRPRRGDAAPQLHARRDQGGRLHAPAAAINPGTPVEALGEVAELLDLALCMSVNPGWGGQPFIAASLDKLARLRALLPRRTSRSRSTAASTRRHGRSVRRTRR